MAGKKFRASSPETHRIIDKRIYLVMIVRIARLELSKLFGSPVAWIVLALFAGITGLDLITHLAEIHDLAKSSSNTTTFSLTNVLLFSRGNGFYDMQRNLMFLLPLLTMGLISQEASSGTIKLLYSSPIKLQSLVLGKFLAITLFSGILVAFCAGAAVLLCTQIVNPDYGLVTAGILGTLCLTLAYCAVGLFMSTLTTYPVIAAIATVVLLFSLNSLAGLTLGIPLLDGLIYWLSISAHLADTNNGLINSKDLLYYLLIVALFVGLSILSLRAQRLQGKPLLKVRGVMAGAVVVALSLGSLSSKPTLNATWDWTATQRHTLHPITQGHIEALNGDLSVVDFEHVFTSYYLGEEYRATALQNWTLYQRFIPKLQHQFVYFNADDVPNLRYLSHRKDLTHEEKTQVIADLYDIPRQDILSRRELHERYPVDPTFGGSSLTQGRLLFSHERFTSIARNFNDAYHAGTPAESEMAAAFKQLQTPPLKVGYLVGNHQTGLDTRKPSDWGSLMVDTVYRYSLVNNGFEVQEIRPNQIRMASDWDLLIIADPKLAFDADALSAVQSYLDQGGNLLLAFEPVRAEVVKPLLDTLALSTNAQILRDDQANPPSHVSFTLTPNGKTAVDSHTWAPVTLEGAAALTPITGNASQLTVTPLLSSAASTNKTDSDASPIVLLSRERDGKAQKIVVSADASLFSNKLFPETTNGPTQEILLIKDLLAWLGDNQYPVRIPTTFDQDTEWQLTNSGFSLFRLLFLLVLPLIPIAVGVVVWRKKSRR